MLLAVGVLTGGRVGAVVAALWYLAMMARNSTVYVGANDPQIAGLAIMGAALVWFLHLWKRKQPPTSALIFMVVAGIIWKHNNIAIPLTALAWLFVEKNRYAVWATIMSAGAALIALLACRAYFGPSFIPNLLATRHYALSNIMGNIGQLQWSALAFVIWAAWAIADRKSLAARFTALHIGLGLFACILQWFGHGVYGNAEFDLIFALAIGIGVTFNRIEASWLAKRIGAGACRDAVVIALLLRLLLTHRPETALLLVSPEFRNSIYASERNVLSEARIVATIPGDAACFTKLVCRLAGKRFAVDEFKTDELVATGKATPAEVAALLDANGITWVPEDPADRGRGQRLVFAVVALIKRLGANAPGECGLIDPCKVRRVKGASCAVIADGLKIQGQWRNVLNSPLAPSERRRASRMNRGRDRPQIHLRHPGRRAARPAAIALATRSNGARSAWLTADYAEKVRSQFLSLRH